MLNKTNITIGVLAVIAMVSFLSFLNTIGAVNLRAGLTSILGTSGLAPVEADYDEDGLTNVEESYWRTDFMNPDTDGDGFLDGEEVKSGHNPTIPGPDDLLVTNLTKGASEVIASGIVEGSLKPDSENYTSSLTTLVNDIENQFELSVTPGLYSPKTVPTDKISVQKYATEFSGIQAIFEKEGQRILDLYDISVDTGLFDGKLKESDKDYEKFQNFMITEIKEMVTDIEKLKEMEVPDKFADNHAQIVYFLERTAKSYESLRLSSQDPLRASFSFMTIYGLFSEDLPALLQDQLPSINSTTL